MLAQTFEDFEENNGLEFKMFFNEVKKEAEAIIAEMKFPVKKDIVPKETRPPTSDMAKPV